MDNTIQGTTSWNITPDSGLKPRQPTPRESGFATLRRADWRGRVLIRHGASSGMNEFERKRVERAVAAFVAKRRPPAEIRDQVDLSFQFDGRYVEIFEIRPQWDEPEEKVQVSIARARYVKSWDQWRVYWKRADLKWHKYDPAPEVRTIQDFLTLVDHDEYGYFFG